MGTSLVVVDVLTKVARLPEPWDAAVFLAALAAVVYAGFTGNPLSLAVATLLYALYTPRFTADAGFYDASSEGLVNALVVAFIAGLVGASALWLRRRQDAANARAVDAEQERARVLSTANDSLQAFTYVVSHDLREPLRAMQILLQALDEDERANLTPEGRDMLDQAKKASDRLRDLTENLLEFSRAAHSDLAGRGPVRLSDVLEDPGCRTRFQSLADEREAVIRTEGGHHAVSATVPTMCQILGNLVLNAIKHNPKDRPHVLVAAEALPDAEVAIRIDDDGPGFPPKVLQSFDGTDRTSGGGFGLTIARRAAERLGGTVKLENRPEGGGRVVVTLPGARD